MLRIEKVDLEKMLGYCSIQCNCKTIYLPNSIPLNIHYLLEAPSIHPIFRMLTCYTSANCWVLNSPLGFTHTTVNWSSTRARGVGELLLLGRPIRQGVKWKDGAALGESRMRRNGRSDEEEHCSRNFQPRDF